MVDLSIPAVGAFPLQVARRYASTHQIDGPLGYGWISSFEARLFRATYLLAAPNVYQKEADVVLPDGEHIRFEDNGNGTFTPETGRYDVLVQNPDGSFDLTLQRSRSILHFAADGRLQYARDDYGNEITYAYDATGLLSRVEDAGGSGRFLDVHWGASGRLSAIVDPIGRQITFDYNSNWTLASVTDPAGRFTRYDYVPGRFVPLLSRVRDHWNRVLTTVTWDANDRVASYTQDGETYTYTFNYQNNPLLTAKVDSAGNRWVYPSDSDGLVTEDRPPTGAGGATKYTAFNADGSVQMSTDETGVKTYYTYGPRGNVLGVTRDYQGSTAVRFEYTYDPNFPDQVTSVTPVNPSTGLYDPNWQATRSDYYQAGSNAPGQLYRTYRVLNDGVTTEVTGTNEYDTKGRLTRTTDARGAVTDYEYETAGNLWKVTAPANNDAGTRPVKTTLFDGVGRATSTTDAGGRTSTFTWDAVDRPLTTTLPKPSSGSTLNFTTTYTYDFFDAATGLLEARATDPNGIITKQRTDQFGRTMETLDPSGGKTSYAYVRGLLASITDANGNVTSYQYNALRRLMASVFPDGAQETYGYTTDGLLSSKTDRKLQTISYTYDAQKRLKRKTCPGGGYVENTYAGQKLTQVYDSCVSPAETHAFTYDSRFRTTSTTQGERGGRSPTPTTQRTPRFPTP
jgi:YD repeat-containing protein